MGHIHGLGGPADRTLIVQAAKTSVFLSLLFLIAYGGTNWLTALRPEAQVATWYFAWEPRLVPYVPLLIVPYMSIDLFFVFAPFLCRDERQLRVFAKRVVFSILVASTFFLLMPLRLVWPSRPVLTGWFGAFVEQSSTAPFLMEYPHNLFPALHITLCLILADLYGRHTRGIFRTMLFAWFGLIAASTELTWQHHLVDVAGGAMLAGFAFYFYQDLEPSLPGTRNIKIGCYYAAGAASMVALASAVWPWGAILLWPAASFGIFAAAYFGLGPGVFRKTDGRVPWSTRFALAIVVIGHHLSLAYYRRRCRAWDEVAPEVLIGRTLTESEAAALVRRGVTAVLDLTAEFSEANALRAANYLSLPILDLTAPTQEQLRSAVAFIAAEAENGRVYVHCKIGYSRSAAVAGAYLLSSGQAATVEEAVAQMRRVRPSIVIRKEAMDALRTFHARLGDKTDISSLANSS